MQTLANQVRNRAGTAETRVHSSGKRVDDTLILALRGKLGDAAWRMVCRMIQVRILKALIDLSRVGVKKGNFTRFS